jgi:MerR family mercuric resistance operon transcriptional regulator
MSSLTIGKVAQQAGVGVETVRFYEREGLIAEPPRGPSGYRHYPESVVPRLLFIKRSKELGFTLNEIKDLLSLRLDPETTCADVRRRAETKIVDIEEKMHSLRRMKKTLLKLTESCNGRGPVDECPILEALDPQERKR